MPTDGATLVKVLRLDPRDNVLVALADLHKGESVTSSGNDYLLLSDVPAKHKFLTQNLSAGEDIIMYGVLVAKATQTLQRGDMCMSPLHTQAPADYGDSPVLRHAATHG